MRKYLLITVLLFLIAPVVLHAGEIQYGYVEDVRDETEALIKYRGPGGEEYFVCDVMTAKCDDFDSNDDFHATDALAIPVKMSFDGRYGVGTVQAGALAFYTLYEVDGDDIDDLGTLPIDLGVHVETIKFSRDNSKIIFRTVDKIITYDIEAEDDYTIDFDYSGYSYWLVSPSGNFVSFYEGDGHHRVVDLRTGESMTVEAGRAGYFEISQNDEWAVFVEGDDQHELHVADLSDFPDDIDTERIYRDGNVIDDYMWHKDRAFFTTNDEGKPLEWLLMEFDPEEEPHNTSRGKKKKKRLSEVDSDISYGDFMRSIDDYLVYHKVDGKNSHVELYDPENSKQKTLSPVKDSSASKDVTRKVDEIEDRTTVIWTPKGSKSKDDLPLFVWLHGGPRRQVAEGYHSYLSYAVYDELMERLVEADARVLKIDYTGSWGYGDDFIDDLKRNVGKKDVEDVLDIVEEFIDDYDTDEVYLIGNSYGGYLSLRTIVDEEADDVLDGAISINGVTDWQDLIERIPSSPFTAQFDGHPSSKNQKYYDRASVVDRLDNLDENVPLLVVYGDKDASVPTWQSTEFTTTAEAFDKNVEIIEYENEEHILRDRDTLDDLCEQVTDLVDLSDQVCS